MFIHLYYVVYLLIVLLLQLLLMLLMMPLWRSLLLTLFRTILAYDRTGSMRLLRPLHGSRYVLAIDGLQLCGW